VSANIINKINTQTIVEKNIFQTQTIYVNRHDINYCKFTC